MNIIRKFFPEITLDNDEVYLQHLSAIIESVDELAEMEIVKGTNSYHFRIVNSHPRYTQLLLQEILKLNNLYQIHLELSKSIKTSGSLVFSINI